MLSAEQNDLITRTNPGTAAGALLRRYWQPAALVDELSGNRPVKPVRLMGEDLVVFRDEQGGYGLVGRHCPHRRTDGWKTAVCAAPFTAGCSTSMASACRLRRSPTTARCAQISGSSPIQ
jgi:hypothetical protein